MLAWPILISIRALLSCKESVGFDDRSVFCVLEPYQEQKQRFKFMSGYNNKNIVLHELVGLNAEVINSSDRAQIGIKGKVIRETKSLLFLDDNKTAKKIVKKISTFKFSDGRDDFVVDGEEIDFRPYERTEKAFKFYKKRRLKP